MCAGILDLFPGYVWDNGSSCSVDVLVVLLEEVIHKLLHLLDIPIVDGSPCLLDNPIDLSRVGGVGARLVRGVWVRWSLYGLHGLCVLLLNGSVDVGLAMGAMESGSCGLLGSLAKLLVLSLDELLVLLV